MTRTALAFLILMSLSGAALAQDGGNLGPSGGAIKGGAIAPGESSGIPDNAPPGVAPVPPVSEERARERCRELTGMLREQCLRDLRSAGAGGTRAPDAPVERDPRLEPPPQNPGPR